MRTLKIILLVFSCLETNAQNDKITRRHDNYLSVELDPVPFILGGYSVSLKFSPKQLKHFAIMGSVYRSNFPDGMMRKENADKGFRDLKIKASYALFADYFIKENRSGFYFGPSVFLYSKSVRMTSSTGTANFNSIYPNIRVGYVYRPFKRSGFYVNPWLNIGKEFISGKNNYLKDQEFSTNSISYVVAIHLGYQLTF